MTHSIVKMDVPAGGRAAGERTMAVSDAKVERIEALRERLDDLRRFL